MSRLSEPDTTHTSLSCNGCDIQIVTSSAGVLLDLQAKHRGTDGHLHYYYSYATLPIADARHLSALLDKAIVFAEEAAVDQPDLVLARAA